MQGNGFLTSIVAAAPTVPIRGNNHMGFAIGSYPMGRTESSWLLCKSVVDSLGRGLKPTTTILGTKKPLYESGLDVKRRKA